ncbi:MAG: nucleoside hydrolase [Planctomycetaceae bacterium]|jgi:inosine-uridine nucleoside N-ribohydrolase|nr:nucleoside hydrolase [Planctomycetaceae bacterium]
MPKKVVFDVDPGIADALLLCLALFDPKFEIIALTSTGGNVPANIAARNLQGIVEYLDPPRLPRLGFGGVSSDSFASEYRHMQGIDTLADTPLTVAELRTHHPAEKVICEAVRSDPENVMVICCGPLTNLARAAAIDPELPKLLRHVYITGGSTNGEGNISACAEYNIYYDVEAAKKVFELPCTKTLVPLNITNQALLTLQHFERLPDISTKIGSLLSSMLMPAFKTYRQCYALEGIHIHDLVTYMTAANPAWAETEELAVEIETEGKITRGMTVFDKRRIPEFAASVDVVTKINIRNVIEGIIEGFEKLAAGC